MLNDSNDGPGCIISIYIFFGICYIINLVKLIQCDFDAPWKEEIIHAIGTILPLAAPVTMWF